MYPPYAGPAGMLQHINGKFTKLNYTVMHMFSTCEKLHTLVIEIYSYQKGLISDKLFNPLDLCHFQSASVVVTVISFCLY